MAAVLFAATGCEEKVYQIEQWPRGDKLWRRLTVSRRQQGDGRQKDLNDADKAELARIARLYGTAPKITGNQAAFVGAFAAALPRDVGGDGHYVHWESQLGSVSIYVERFRGFDDPVATLEAKRKTADQLVELVIGWFDSELHDNSEWPRLRKFFDTSLRHDLQNLSIYSWLANIRPESESKNPDILFRVIQYLVERHYASYEEAPALVRDFQEATERNESGPIFARIRRLLLTWAGAATDGRLAHGLGFLKDAPAAWASWRQYFEQTVYYKREREEFRQREEREKSKPHAPALANAKAAKRAQPVVAIDKEEFERSLYFKFLASFLGFGSGDSTRAQVSLEAPREPFWTNGKWNAKERRVEWSEQIPEADNSTGAQSGGWPGICGAAWDDPDEQAQKRLLGKVGITGNALFDYNLWYQGLSNQEKQEWDTFLPTARGHAKLADRLEEFAVLRRARGAQRG
jgi:hypothetical protein